MAYFGLIGQQQKAGTYSPDNHSAYLTKVYNPADPSGAPKTTQGLDPYQQAGGIDWARFYLDKGYQQEVIKNQQEQLKFQKGQATGWVDGARTMEGVKRDDDLRRNPMNAAIYEQERRGFRSGTGNEDPEAYSKGPVGDENGGGGNGGGSSPAPGGPAPARVPKIRKGLKKGLSTIPGRAPKRADRVWDEATEAFYNPETNQYSFATKSGAPRFGLGASASADLSGANTWRNTKGAGDDRVGVGTDRQVDKGSMSRVVQDLNKRMGSLTPEAAKAYAAYDASKVQGRMDGGPVDIPGYTGRSLSELTPAEQAAFARDFGTPEMAAARKDYAARILAQDPSRGATPMADIDARFQSNLQDVAFVRDTARDIQNLRDAGADDNTFRSKDWRERLSRLNQILDIDIDQGTAYGSGLFDTSRISGYPDANLVKDYEESGADDSDYQKQRDAADFMVKHAKDMDWQNPQRVLDAYNPDWYKNRYNLSYATDTPRPLKTGGEMTIGGAPHWIVNPMGKPVAALTEDGKAETIKGKGGVEVIPTDPARKSAYMARKGGNRPGAASGNSTKTLSGKTTLSKEVNARTKGAKAGDGRARNGKTNNGRPRDPGNPAQSGVTDRDAASVRKVVRGPMVPPIDAPVMNPGINSGNPGIATVPVQEPSGAVMPYRPTPWGEMAPVFVMGRALGGMLPSSAYGGLGGASNTFVKKGMGSHDDFSAIMRGEKSLVQTTRRSRTSVNGQPAVRAPGNPSGVIPGMPAMDASGGNRVIGNETAPMARYGFDKNAPIDIAARGATRGVKGSPGVQVAQPWKQAPRALMTRGTFGNQLLQSYWNATGGAPEDLADRGRAAAPGQAGSQRAYV